MKDKAYLAQVAELPCVVCGNRPVQVHHASGGSIANSGIAKGIGRKTGDQLALPLCLDHHTGNHGIHRGVKTWEALYGPQTDMLANVAMQLKNAPQRTVERPVSKILPRRGL